MSVQTVQRWGNSLAVRLPKAYVEEVRLTEGATVNVTVAKGRIMIEPAAAVSFALDDLVAGITRANIHGEFDTGTARGKEIW